MNSETVYQVAKALPKEEQFLLFEKLKNDFITPKISKNNATHLLTKKDAFHYLLSHVFTKKIVKSK
ncbi:MAG: hypothetical protein AB8B78_13580 [Polaribacter sp.]